MAGWENINLMKRGLTELTLRCTAKGSVSNSSISRCEGCGTAASLLALNGLRLVPQLESLVLGLAGSTQRRELLVAGS